MSGDVPEECRPRLCHVVKWDDFPGYGFNLHAEKGKAGQFIGKVDAHSPAEAALLKEGDRIVEVNGVNIGNENHQQVVNRIRTGGEETRLLVVDNGTDDWFKEEKQVIKGDLPCVLFGTAKRDTISKEDEPEPEPVVESAPVEEDIPVVEDVPVVESTPEPEPIPEPEVEVAPVVVPVANGNGINGDDLHTPRLCHLKLWPHFQGYGFNLHAERDKPGQFIGLVDDDSPASTAGLMVQDRIIEVNGTNVEKEGHADVIGRIKAVSGETRLLVLDPEADAYYRERGVTVSSSMPQTVFISTPDADSVVVASEDTGVDLEEATYETVGSVAVLNEVEKEEEKEEDKKEEKEEEEEEKKEEVEEREEEKEEESKEDEKPTPTEPEVIVTVSEPPAEPEPEVVQADVTNGNSYEEPPAAVSPPEPEPQPEPEPEFTVAGKQEAAPEPYVAPAPAPTPAAPSAKGEDGLELNLSVSEMRERLKAKKRQDPRLNKVPFEQKYRQFQRM